MTPQAVPKPHPTYWNVIQNIALTVWFFVALGSVAHSVILSAIIPEILLLAIMFTLFIGGLITLTFSALIALPLLFFHLFARTTYANLTILTGCAVAGLMAALYVYAVPLDYSGTVIGTSKQGNYIIIISTFLGGLSAWTGLWLTRRGKKHDLK